MAAVVTGVITSVLAGIIIMFIVDLYKEYKRRKDDNGESD